MADKPISIQVTTIQGERWDQLSTRVYGRADRYQRIIENNPQLDNAVLFAPVLPAGLVLTLPTITDSSQFNFSPSNTPQAETVGIAPWRR